MHKIHLIGLYNLYDQSNMPEWSWNFPIWPPLISKKLCKLQGSLV